MFIKSSFYFLSTDCTLNDKIRVAQNTISREIIGSRKVPSAEIECSLRGSHNSPDDREFRLTAWSQKGHCFSRFGASAAFDALIICS